MVHYLLGFISRRTSVSHLDSPLFPFKPAPVFREFSHDAFNQQCGRYLAFPERHWQHLESRATGYYESRTTDAYHCQQGTTAPSNKSKRSHRASSRTFPHTLDDQNIMAEEQPKKDTVNCSESNLCSTEDSLKIR